MPLMEEADLLHRYVREKSDNAFRELVRREIGLVYSAALRQVGGNPHLAEEVTQAVFTALAAKASQVMHHPSLVGWLHTSTHFAAAKLLRSERRRQHHETQAGRELPVAAAPAAPQAIAWREISAVLDDAVRELPEGDRSAVLLRFFEGHSLAAVGKRLGLSEDAARKRISRALEQLKAGLERRGLAASAGALSVTLAEGAIAPVPAGLGVSAATVALTAAAAGEPLIVVSTLALTKKIAAGILIGTAATIAVVQLSPRKLVQTPAPATGVFPAAPPVPIAPPPSGSTPPETSAATATGLAGPMPPDLDLIIADYRRREAALVASGMLERAKADADLYRETMTKQVAGNPDFVPPSAVDAAALAALTSSGTALTHFRAISSGDLSSPLSYILTALPHERRQMLVPALFQAWFERDADSAREAVSRSDPTVLGWALSGWAGADLGAAWGWTESQASIQRANLRRGILERGVAAGHASILAGWVQSSAAGLAPAERQATANHLVGPWAVQDFTSAESWLTQFDASYPGSYAKAAVSLGAGAAHLAPEDFDRLLARQDDAGWQGLLSGTVWALVGTEHTDRLRDLIAQTDSLPDSRHDAMLRSLALPIENSDPDLAFELLRRLRDPQQRDEHLAMIGGAAAAAKPELALQVLLSVQDPTLQAKGLINTYLRLQKQNPIPAERFLAQPGFPSAIRNKLLTQK